LAYQAVIWGFRQFKPVSFGHSHIYQQSVKFLLAFASALALFFTLVLTPSIALSQTTADPCDEQATCQAQRGSQLLAQGRVEDAAVALEKALLLDPNLPGAQLDYAQALALIGLKGSARAMLADVLQRPDIQPGLKAKLVGSHPPTSDSVQTNLQAPWQWSKLAQAAVGHETNLNISTFTDSLTLMLSNGPVTIGLSDSAKPVAGPASKTLLAVQGTTRAGSGLLALGEFSVGATFSNKNALQKDSLTGIKPDRNQTAEAVAKYSLPMIAGAASGQWQFSVGITQFWLSTSTAYSDTGFNVKFNWDRTFEPAYQGLLGLEGPSCKLAPSLGQTRQSFPLSASLNGVYAFARMELLCKAQSQESQVVLGSGSDRALEPSRPGGDKKRIDFLLRHERLMPLSWSPLKQVQTGQLSTWVRFAKSADALIYSELLGDLKTTTHRADWGVGFWVPLDKSWSAGLNLEATSQRSNNALFNLKNSGVYAGIRWSEN
jgi:hypothetical protein